MSTFTPKEILFATTTECNLHCPHCFINRKKASLSIEKAKILLKDCAKNGIERVGFTGGEPFLYKEFIQEITKTAIECNLLFDRIMTNGIWWIHDLNPKKMLYKTLKDVFDSGFDGKFGVSFDSFHNQTPKDLIPFFKTIYEIWNDTTCIEIQSVINPQGDNKFLRNLKEFSQLLNLNMNDTTNKNGEGSILLENGETFIQVYRCAQSFLSESKKGWKESNKEWFKDDFCEGPGHIFYVHANGKIAPCCGFANEHPKLSIGTIENSYKELMKNAQSNKMIDICYKKGLSQKRKDLEKYAHIFPGSTKDICMFCDYICKLEE